MRRRSATAEQLAEELEVSVRTVYRDVEALTTAQLKLRAALPEELRGHAGRIQERFLLDAPGWYGHADRTPHLAAAAAVLDIEPAG